MSKNRNTPDLCGGCVYYPPNLPRDYYPEADWQVLQALDCAHECLPGSQACVTLRKTHCDLVDLRVMVEQKRR